MVEPGILGGMWEEGERFIVVDAWAARAIKRGHLADQTQLKRYIQLTDALREQFKLSEEQREKD